MHVKTLSRSIPLQRDKTHIIVSCWCHAHTSHLRRAVVAVVDARCGHRVREGHHTRRRVEVEHLHTTVTSGCARAPRATTLPHATKATKDTNTHETKGERDRDCKRDAKKHKTYLFLVFRVVIPGQKTHMCMDHPTLERQTQAPIQRRGPGFKGSHGHLQHTIKQE